ncbi:hypothetical protein ACWCP6_04025 [Streptomyces sp. NPDC002004]
MAASSSGFVAGLTGTSLAVIGALAFQAAAAVPDEPRPGATPTVQVHRPPKDRKHPEALPAESGIGERVVYSLEDDRVWLVGPSGKAQRTYKVTPSAVDPAPGQYAVTSRTRATSGSDGRSVEHVVRFASVKGVPIGFSAAVSGAMERPEGDTKTGGIRETREDGYAMWMFATIGKRVVVIP